MSIPPLKLDDRTYEDIVAEMRALIPRYAPEWTDHNASDPGIMLVELFSWLSEAIMYRLNRIPVASELRFLQLLDPLALQDFEARNHTDRNGGRLGSDDMQAALQAVFNRTAHKLHTSWRAVTAEDFEQLASCLEPERVARVKCIPERDLTACSRRKKVCPEHRTRPGHVSLVVVAKSSAEDPYILQRDLHKELDQRCLINTHLHVVGPRYIPIYVAAEVVLAPRARWETVRNNLLRRLGNLFEDGSSRLDTGEVVSTASQDEFEPWMFGRPVTSSEVHQRIEETEGIDYVSSLHLFGRSFQFCMTLGAVQPPATDPVEIAELNEGKLPVRLKTAFACHGIDASVDLPVQWDKEMKRWRVEFSSEDRPQSDSGSASNDYEVARNGRLLDIYGPFEQAQELDGIAQFELPIDGLVCFCRQLTMDNIGFSPRTR